MRVLGIVGWSGSGKTTLVEGILPVLAARGLRVSTIKRCHHGFDMDTPGKDSWRHRQAGAHEVMVASDARWALLREMHDESALSLVKLLARMEPVDLCLVEGFTTEPHPRIEVWRSALHQPLRSAPSPQLLAVASPAADQAEARKVAPWLDLNAPSHVAEFILQQLQAAAAWGP